MNRKQNKLVTGHCCHAHTHNTTHRNVLHSSSSQSSTQNTGASEERQEKNHVRHFVSSDQAFLTAINFFPFSTPCKATNEIRARKTYGFSTPSTTLRISSPKCPFGSQITAYPCEFRSLDSTSAASLQDTATAHRGPTVLSESSATTGTVTTTAVKIPGTTGPAAGFVQSTTASAAAALGLLLFDDIIQAHLDFVHHLGSFP